MSEKSEHLITQKTFRTLLQAMSHPGRIYEFAHESVIGSRETELQGLFSVLLTLLDHEVAFAVKGCGEEFEQKITRVTGSMPASLKKADFIIVPSGDSEGEILMARRGALEYPDAGATVIYLVKSLSDCNGAFDKDNGAQAVVLKGPGIYNEIAAAIGGLNRQELFYLKEINSEYPLGVDSIFIDGSCRVMCIPRSTRIEVV